MRIKDLPTLWGVLLTVAVCKTMGGVVLTVKPYPARIYAHAPPGTPVLWVDGYEDRTGAKLDRMYVSPGVNSSYFSINVTTGLLSVKKRIDWALGTTLSFFVYGGVGGSLQFKHVQIIVSVKNIYAPSFPSNIVNNFKVYRYAIGERIGTVVAQDKDPDRYNNIFTYKIADERADTYLRISSVGEITLKSPPPESIGVLVFKVTATDEGSPQLTGSTMVQVSFANIRQPSIFCFATDVTSTTLCWKNAMVGRPELTGFEVEVTGAMDKTLMVTAKGDEEEVCEEVDGTEINNQYFFRVSVKTTTSTNLNRMKIMINTTGIGFTPQCLHNDFDSCKYLKPCQNGAMCRRHEDGALNYHCDCTAGWQGKNCTLQDLCTKTTCQNGGSCHFEGHRQYECECMETFYGKTCQHFNACSITPCHNNGTCTMDSQGRYTCDCPDHFTGKNCEQRNPCQPSPCNNGSCTRISDERFSCRCPNGYYGNTCNEINPCDLKQPCTNGGTCEHIGNDTFVCHCPFETTGPRCNLYDPCAHSPCQNEALCVVKPTGAYKCECLPGYYGGECQHFNTCHAVGCGNGSCKETPNGPTCVCNLGYYGDKCELYNACVGENPCELRGQCRNISNGFECDCLPERYGLHCQYVNSCRLHDVCENGGTCENIVSQETGRFKCKCLAGYYDETCTSYNPCVSNPCIHGDCKNTSSENYRCDCQDGYYGKNCELKSPCMTSPCLNQGTCKNINTTAYACTCLDDFVGTNCELNNPCTVPCDNSGTCSVDPFTFGKICHCTEMYTGQNCESRVPQCDATTCKNGGTCNLNQGLCQCTSEYTGLHCETEITPCTVNPCTRQKVCVLSTNTKGHECVCPNNADNEDCIEDCPEEETFDKTGRYSWPRTPRGQRVIVECGHPSQDDRAMVIRDCRELPGNKARWSVVNSEPCPELGLAAAEKKLNELKSLTSNPAAVDADQLANYTNMLEEVFSYSLTNTQIADGVTSVVSNLADVNESVTIESESNNRTSKRLVSLLNIYTADTTNTKRIATNNINVHAVDVSDTSREVNYEPMLMNGNDSIESGISLTLPPEVFVSQDSTSSLPYRVQFVGFKKSVYFMSDDATDDDYTNQRVVTATVKGAKIHNLSTPVVYKLRNVQRGANHTCFYWDPETSTWKNDGVRTVQSSDNTTECHSNHLTSFAILMDPNPHGSAVSAVHEQILTYISYVGCAISMAGLILTILTYGLFRCLNKDKSGKILLNLCVSMLLMNVVFLMGSQSASTYGEQLCTAVAVMLHYFLLATLMWMLVEALEMYQALITVFAKYARFYMTKRCIVAWGVPLIIVVITLAVDVQHYNPPQDFCFISQASQVAYYVALVAPGCIIVVVNTIVFIMVARVILKPRFQQQQREDKEHVTPAQVRGAFTVMILLGVTWVFGPLAINEAKVVFNYMFCILNSLQGFFIFVFRCVFNPEARLAWYQLIKMGTLKTKRGPIKSVYSETSSKAEHTKTKSNGHFGGTLKSNIMQSNGWHHPKLNGIPPEHDGARRDTQCFTMSHNSEENMYRNKDDMYLDNNTPPTRMEIMEDGFTHL